MAPTARNPTNGRSAAAHGRQADASAKTGAPIGFIGLGHMGGNMAARLLAAGYEVHGEAQSRD
jgi:phosphoglycerate dehydrogenase-like enzyme